MVDIEHVKVIRPVSLDNLDQKASEILDLLGDTKICLLDGQMGAGKTTLIRALCKALNVVDNVTSPTFALVNEYESPTQTINHFDFYRVKTLEEALDAGIEDYFYSGNLCLIEWPAIITEILPEKLAKIEIEVGDNEERIYKISLHGIK